MIFCIDIGNSNIKYAVFDNDILVTTFRVTSEKRATSDEYGIKVKEILNSANITKADIEGVIMSSVNPSLNYTLEHMCIDYLGKKPITIGPGLKTGIDIKADNPREVGSDIIVDTVCGYKKYGGKTAVICIDFGTATTFDIISKRGELLGVSIAPGVKSALNSLVSSTAKLPNIELVSPKCAIGKNTVACMQSGIIYGFAGLVENIVSKIKLELGTNDVKVVATGGLCNIISKECNCIDVIDRTLTLEGLKIIYQMNQVK